MNTFVTYITFYYIYVISGFSSTFKRFLNNLFCVINFSLIIENAPKLEGTKTFTNVENLAQNKRVEIQLNFPIKIGKVIDGFGGNQAIYNAYNAEYLGNPYDASRWHWLAYWQINASLPLDLKLEFGLLLLK